MKSVQKGNQSKISSIIHEITIRISSMTGSSNIKTGVNNMIKNIDVKTHCYLLMINKQFLEMFDTNEMWKRQFVKTTPLKILDTSIHIGPCGGYNVNEVPLSYWKHDTNIHLNLL